MRVVCPDCNEPYWCAVDRGCPHCAARVKAAAPVGEPWGGIPQHEFIRTVEQVEAERPSAVDDGLRVPVLWCDPLPYSTGQEAGQ